MATNANVLAVASSSLNATATENVLDIRSASKLDVPAIGNYGPRYLIVYTRKDGTVGSFGYDTSAHRNTAMTNFNTNFGTTF